MPDDEQGHVQRSFAAWLIDALGIYAAVLPLAAFLAFLLAIVLLVRGRGHSVGPALLLIVLGPLLVGVVGALHGMAVSLSVIAASDVSPRPSELAEATSMAIVAPMVAILLSLPTYAVATLGLLVRALLAPASDALVQNRNTD